jgi:hypothetical protein
MSEFQRGFSGFRNSERIFRFSEFRFIFPGELGVFELDADVL